MKVCTVTHMVPSFGEITAGSLWADDSPYIVEADCFAEVGADDGTDQPVRRQRKVKPATNEGDA